MISLHQKIIHMPQWSSYNGENLYNKSMHIQMMLDTDFIVLVIILLIPSLVSSDFCDVRRSSSSVAPPSFDLASCLESHWFYRFHCRFPYTTLCLHQIFCNTRISIWSVTLSSLDCSSCILSCNSTRRF